MSINGSGHVPPADPRDIELTYQHGHRWWFEADDAAERWHVSADVVDDTGQPVDHVGEIEIVTVDPYETKDPFGLLDGEEGDLGAVAGAIFDPATGRLNADLDEELEPFGHRILILNSAKLTPAWRGFGLGVVLTGIAIKKLSGGARAVACYPAPLGGPDHDTVEHQLAVATLGDVWAQLGFEHFRDGVHVLDLNLVTLDNALKELRGRLDQHR